MTLRTSYPPIEPYRIGFLPVSPLHELYYEESGNPQGVPILFLHGGPGAGTRPSHRCFFDPAHYRIVLFDQRGAGKSRPHASLEENTTWDLVEDIETLRKYLGIKRWIVFGGSWGSTLALAYAITYPKKVAGLILRSIFLFHPYELDFTYQQGANFLFPEAWQNFVAIIPKEKRGNLIEAYHELLISPDLELRRKAAIEWTRWEATLTCLIPNPAIIERATEDQFALSFARTIIHYFHHWGFFPRPGYLLEEVGQIRHLPGYIIHGRYDLVCPVQSAWELHQAWPEATFQIVPDAAHGATEIGMTHWLLEATDTFRNLKIGQAE